MYWKNRNTPAACDGRPQRQLSRSRRAGGLLPELGELRAREQLQLAAGPRFPPLPISNNTTWHKGDHQVKFGGTWEHADSVGYWGFFDPARVYLLSPEFLAGVNPALPALFGLPDGIIRSQADLEAAGGDVPAGHRRFARSRRTTSRTRARNNRYHLYAQDSWQATPTRSRSTSALGWQHETNVLNHDLDKPAYLAPIYGSDLSADEEELQELLAGGGLCVERSAGTARR